MRRGFSPILILTTVLAALGVAGMIRLGMWQLDRLEQRRAFNDRVTAQMERPVLDMSAELPVDELYNMEYRSAVVRGEYDHSQEVLLRNQVWQNRMGYRVLTPLILEENSQAVLVDRGWIPFEDADNLQKFAEPGVVTVEGMIRRPQSRPDFGGVPEPTLAPGQTRMEAVNIVNLEQLQGQVNTTLLPVYIQQAPTGSSTSLPYRSLTEIQITEGPHFGYAIQWFTFATILALGYPVLIYRRLKGSPEGRSQEPA